MIGGHFYRGCSLQNMDGAFIFGDSISGYVVEVKEHAILNDHLNL